MKIFLILVYLTTEGFEEKGRYLITDLGDSYTTKAYEWSMRECERVGNQVFVTHGPVPEPYMGVATYCEAVQGE